ncbi:MAG TPA: SGNH/GDSL hydrolase family protein [Candidatus Saccharimonadales bacterium]|nr:SGNH/GDSL hydrolase family protein [Candidatus Saccharimonadales bacterium]
MPTSAQSGSTWFSTDAPSLSKTAELIANREPGSNNTDCSPLNYIQKGDVLSQMTCTFMSPLGTATTDGRLQIGSDNFVRLSGPTKQSVLIPTVGPTLALVSLTAPTIGNNIGVYHNLTKKSLQASIFDGPGESYYISAQPDEIVRNQQTNEPLQLNTLNIGFSANGQWMIANMPKVGLVRVNMTDFNTKLFAGTVEPDWYLGLANPSLAISNDGQYAAANTDIFGTGNLNVYDLSTCDDQLNVPSTKRHYCTNKNIWADLLNQLPGVEYPTHLRFVNDDNISFSARYDISDASYKAAAFVVTAPSVAQHKIGLLGMGDSYISGQGTFMYRDGTDTANDFCHLSELSYPFILGKAGFNSYNSIACSGATTDNVIGINDKYLGQVRDKIKEKDRGDKGLIFANFLPGYLYQQEFAAAYTPEAIVLSVGGDDVHFADIVKKCVNSPGGGTCYDTYEDRAELVDEINRTYPKLVNTYTTLRQQSGGARLYVVGYPQVAKPDGDCGLNVLLDNDELTFSAALVDYLDGVIQKAAQTAGVFYVDAQHAFDGHRLCESGAKAMNGLTAGNDGGVNFRGKTYGIGAESYHPTVLGYQLLADTIAQATSNLSAPMPPPAPSAAPRLAPDVPILKDMPKSGRATRQVTSDGSIADDAAVRGDKLDVAVNGSGAQLKPGSGYQVVLHSTPVLLDEGGVDADGNISVTVHIPAGTEPGYHTLHVYATDMAGGSVDIQKVIYIAASVDDLDGDGIPDDTDSCPAIPPSGQDADKDGVDDACDGDITMNSANGSGQTTINQGTVTAQPATGTTNEEPAPTAVLGDSVGANTQLAPQPSANLTVAPIMQKLFRLDWITVLEAGLVFTGTGTVLYALVRRA